MTLKSPASAADERRLPEFLAGGDGKTNLCDLRSIETR